MGSSLAFVVAGLALAVALASWIAGAVFSTRAMAGESDGRRVWLAALGWPFLRLKGAAAAHAPNINKALVAFFASLMVAAAAISVATNLSRVAR